MTQSLAAIKSKLCSIIITVFPLLTRFWKTSISFWLSFVCSPKDGSSKMYICPSFSGGEVQRLKLASHLQKEGQIYILDEPSLGLHTKDNQKLIDVFQNLVNKGNTVIIIEHNLDFIAASDWVIE